jgi:hypothetical protein
MKSKKEIEKLATKNYRSNGSGGGQYTEGLQDGRKIGFVDGYTKCQEDNKDKKYTEEDMIGFFGWSLGMEVVEMICHNKTKQEIFQVYLNSLNK